MVCSTQEQISKVTLNPSEPLIIIDADEVIVHFAKPFSIYLKERGLILKLNGYTLKNAILDLELKTPIDPRKANSLIIDFIKFNTACQPATPFSVKTLDRLSTIAQIIILSNVPRYAHAERIKNFKYLGLNYQFLSNVGPKGPAVKLISEKVNTRVIFIDDNNLQIESAKAFVPAAFRLHFTGCELVRPHLVKTEAATHMPKSWKEVLSICQTILS